MKANPDDKKFLDAVKKLKVGEELVLDECTLICEYIFDVPTHFVFHQRIFEPGVILKKTTSNTRIFIEAEKLGMKIKHKDMNNYKDNQIEMGVVLPADRGRGYKG